MIDLGLSVALKATLLILLALFVHLLVGRRRVLVRSVVGNACLLGLLLLPVSEMGFPRLPLEDPRGSVSLPAAAPEPAPDGARAVGTLPPPPRAVIWPVVVVLVYTAVAAGLLVRLLVSLLAVARLRWSCPAVLEPRWVEALERWQGRLGLRRKVRLARAPSPGVPAVVGWLRPVILLPENLVESAAAPIDAILLHELAHVRRGDYAWNILLRLVQIFYWPHPLVWPLGRIIVGVREQACDDLCVTWLGGAADYREALLQVTAGLVRRRWEALGLAMSRSTKLGRRLARLEWTAGASRCLLPTPARGMIVVAVLAAFGLFGSVTLVRPRADEPKPRRQDQAGDRRVRVERVKPGQVHRTTSQIGSLHSFESAELYSKVSGYLKQQHVDIGDRVKQGDLLAVIDAPELIKEAERAAEVVAQARLAVTQAEARVKTARSDLEVSTAAVPQAEAEVARAAATTKFREKEVARFQKLKESNAIPQQILDEEEQHRDAAVAAERSAAAAVEKARAERTTVQSRVGQALADLLHAKGDVRLAESDRERAMIMTNYTRMVSPYDGVITLRSFHRGAFVRAADAGTQVPLFTVARTDRMRVVTYVPDRDVPFLERGLPAEVTLDAKPGQVFKGKVSRFAETEDPQSRTMRTEIDLDNSGHKLREGMHGKVTIVLNELDDGLTIPNTAVFPTPGDTGFFGSDSCYCVVDGLAELTRIKVRQSDLARALVWEGLKEGDIVIVDPEADGVEEGQRVEVESR